MLPKKNRADKKAVERIFKEGKIINSEDLTFRFLSPVNSGRPRVSIIVPKIISKKAVTRNRLRRLGYAALSNNIDEFPPLLGVFVFKKYEEDISKIEHEIKDILNKID